MGGSGEEEAAAATTHRQSMRIYIGEVGPTVTASDVESTFSSLGRVAGVEFVRKSGRNFAYMDFEPHSEKTLAKLFSTYNGCAWKGGKLKLERAKEHYLDRLKREWVEDAKVMSESPADLKIQKAASNSKLERLNLENMQLQIFFPKLRKVKSLPFKGTGKHKYSFQRIEVPPLPIHFCDCEEHTEPSEKASQKYLSSLINGIHYEKELNVMNSVMNKLFAKENAEQTANETPVGAAENSSDPRTKDIHEEESEEIVEMDDNLVTNIGVGRSDDLLMLLGGKLAVNKESRVAKHEPSESELGLSKANSKKRPEADSVDISETTTNMNVCSELAANIPENKFTVISASSDGHFQEPDISAEPTVKKRQSMLQKSSWKHLVGEAKKSSFSITSVLAGTSSQLAAKPRFADSVADKSTMAKKVKDRVDRKKSKTLPVMHDLPLEKEDTGEGQYAGCSDASETEINEKGHSEVPVKIVENESRTMFPIKTTSEDYSEEPEVSADPSYSQGETEPSMAATESTKGQSWLQKSSWKDLVGGMGSSSFSITSILPGISSLQPMQPKSVDEATDTLIGAKKVKPQPDRRISKGLTAVEDPSPEKASGSKISGTSLDTQDLPLLKVPGEDEIRGKEDRGQAHADCDEHKESQKTGGLELRETRSETSASRVCTFMRSEESMKQWSQAKAALSRHLNKKRKKNEDDSLQPQKMRQKMR